MHYGTGFFIQFIHVGPFIGLKSFDFILINYLSSRGGQPISNFKRSKIKVLPEALSVQVLTECIKSFDLKGLK